MAKTMPLASANTELLKCRVSTPAFSASTTEAGTRRPIGLDSRLRGNDMVVGLIQTYQVSIFLVVIDILAPSSWQ
jgi:hypothetical protein